MHATGAFIRRLVTRERLGSIAYGAFIFAIVPGLLGGMLVFVLHARGHHTPAMPGPAPVTVVPAPLTPPAPAAPPASTPPPVGIDA